jgi:uncharacterized protein
MSPFPAAAARTNPWIVFLLPLLVYMIVGSFEPAAPADRQSQNQVESNGLGLAIPYRAYPAIYTAKIVLTLAAIVFVWPAYRQFTWRVSWLAIVVGVVGVVTWIWLAAAQRGLARHLGWDFALGKRSAFNPLAELVDRRAWAYGFLAIRFFGLVVIVPIIEEFFLRGFLMRFVMAADWWKVPLGNANWLALVVGTLVPVLMHPQEALAAAVWFSLVSWLMLRTRNIWDCIAAHAATNLLLGVYVVATGNWWLM